MVGRDPFESSQAWPGLGLGLGLGLGFESSQAWLEYPESLSTPVFCDPSPPVEALIHHLDATYPRLPSQYTPISPTKRRANTAHVWLVSQVIAGAATSDDHPGIVWGGQ